MSNTYLVTNAANAANKQDTLVVSGAVTKKIIDTTSNATYNYICTNLRDDAVETDSNWQISRWPKLSPFIKQWAVVSITGKPTSAYVFKASDRTNLNFG